MKIILLACLLAVAYGSHLGHEHAHDASSHAAATQYGDAHHGHDGHYDQAQYADAGAYRDVGKDVYEETLTSYNIKKSSQGGYNENYRSGDHGNYHYGGSSHTGYYGY